MAVDWIPQPLQDGKITVTCHTCDTVASFNPESMSYECDCRFSATAEALALGLPGYTCEPPVEVDLSSERNRMKSMQ